MGNRTNDVVDHWPWWSANTHVEYNRPLPHSIGLQPGSDGLRYYGVTLSLGRVGDPEYSTVYSETSLVNSINLGTTHFETNEHEFDLTAVPPIKAMSSKYFNHTLNIKKPLYWFDCELVDHDPHEVNILSTFKASLFSDLLKGLLGDESVFSVPYRYRFDGVPWLLDDTRGDFRSVIDWESFEEIVQPLFTGHNYDVSLQDGDFNFGKNFWQELFLHGVQPTYSASFIDKQWMIGFHPMGFADKTQATWSGRLFDGNSLISGGSDGYELIGSSVLTKLNISLNWNGEKYGTNFVAVNNGAKQINAKSEAKIESKISKIENAGEVINNPTSYMQIQNNLFSRILRAYTSPKYDYKTSLSLAKLWSAGVGKEAVITDSSVGNVLTGATGLSEQGIIITSVTHDFMSPNAKVGIKYRLEPSSEYTIAPAMLVPANASTKDASKITATPSTHAFSGTTDRVDMSWFDCLNYDSHQSDDPEDAANYTAKVCSCSDYGVYSIDLTEESPTPLELTAKSIDIDAGTCELWGTTTTWDVTHAHVVIFTKWNDSDTQDCQRTFLCLSNAGGKLIDDGANETRGHRIL